MNSFIVHTQNEAQEKAVKAVLEALEIEFEEADKYIYRKDESVYILPEEIINEVKESEAQIDKGEYQNHDDIMKEFKKYL